MPSLPFPLVKLAGDHVDQDITAPRKPDADTEMLYVPGGNSGKMKWPAPSDFTVMLRFLSVSCAVICAFGT